MFKKIQKYSKYLYWAIQLFKDNKAMNGNTILESLIFKYARLK